MVQAYQADQAYTVRQIQAAEQALRARLAEGALMQRAATGLSRVCAQELVHRRGRVYGSVVVLLVGKGNNGADALWAGAQLTNRGASVTAVCLAEPVASAAEAFRRAGGRLSVTCPERVGAHPLPAAADLTVDGLLGIGSRGALRAEHAALLARSTGLRVAVDVPSGVNADTGEFALAEPDAGPVPAAEVTVTFGAYKPGLLVGAGRRLAGRVELVDIGLAPYLDEDGPHIWSSHDGPPGQMITGVPHEVSGLDKYSRGVLGVAAGSQTYTGAAVLSVGAALTAGAGMVRFAGAPHAAEQVRSRWPEVVVTEATGAGVLDAGRVQAWVVGPGLGADDVAAETVKAVLGTAVPVLVDADALTICAQHQEWLRDRTAPTVLTPHDREFARFGTEVGDDRIGAARTLSKDLGVVVLLKGIATVVANPDGDVFLNRTGDRALATAGSGDVLSGAAGALLAVGHDHDDPCWAAFVAAASAAHLHGLAGSISAGGASTTAGRVLAAWPAAVRTVEAARLDG